MQANDNFLHGTHVKDTLALLKEDYQHLSPTHGAALMGSNYLFNLYHYGIESHATVQLVREMFYCADLNDTIKDTRNKSKPAYFLHPNRIALILACLEMGCLQNGDWQYKIIDPWYRESRCSKSSLYSFISLIVESQIEWKRGIYFQHCTGTIFLSLLWKRAVGKEDLMDYLLAVNNHLQDNVFTENITISEPSIKQWINSEFLTSELSSLTLVSECMETFSSSFASSNSSLSLPASSSSSSPSSSSSSPGKSSSVSTLAYPYLTSPAAITGRHIELLVARKFYLQVGQFPPKIPVKYYGYKGLNPRPDCCEVTIRNVINMVLFDPIYNRFAIERLDELNARNRLKLFYMGKYRESDEEQEPTVQSTRSQKSGKAWMHMMSSIDGVAYLSGQDRNHPYEVEPGASNLLKVFNFLFRGKAKDMSECGPMLLSTKDCKVKTEVIYSMPKGSTIKFTFIRSGYEVGPFYLYSGVYHTSFKHPPAKNNNGDNHHYSNSSRKHNIARDEVTFPLLESLWKVCLAADRRVECEGVRDSALILGMSCSGGGDCWLGSGVIAEVAPLVALMCDGREDVLRKKNRNRILKDKTLTLRWMYHLLLSLPQCKRTRKLAAKARKRFPELKTYYKSLHEKKEK